MYTLLSPSHNKCTFWLLGFTFDCLYYLTSNKNIIYFLDILV